jgi:hypothetical protein
MERKGGVGMDKAAFEAQLIEGKAERQHERDQLLRRVAEIDEWIRAADVMLSQKPVPPLLLVPPDEEPRQSTNLAGMTVVEACVAVLSMANRPMKVSDLWNALYAGGLRLNSKTPKQSVNIMLQRSSKFLWVRPGTYALADYHSTNQPKTRGGRLNAEGPTRGAIRVLKEHGGPMHVKEIYEALKASGFRSNAKYPTAMLSGTFSRSKRFRAMGNDNWDLAERT